MLPAFIEFNGGSRLGAGATPTPEGFFRSLFSAAEIASALLC